MPEKQPSPLRGMSIPIAGGLASWGLSVIGLQGVPLGIAIIATAGAIAAPAALALFGLSGEDTPQNQSRSIRIVAAAWAVIVFSCAIVGYGQYRREIDTRKMLINALQEGEEIKAVCDQQTSPEERFKTWFNGVERNLDGAGLSTCLASFKYPQSPNSYTHGWSQRNEDIWNTVNRRTDVLARCIDNPR